MTEETTAEPRSAAQDTVAMAAATMGHDIVAAMLAELRTLPGSWETLSAEIQQKAIERMKDKTAATVRKAIGFMLTSNFAAVPAKLEYVSRKKGISAGLTIETNAQYRHALFDAQGRHVLVVMAEPEKWLERMDEIKARGDQLDLFNPDANYDPAQDQPGYRRDRDPLAPGATWDEMKKQLGMESAAAADPDAPKGDETAGEPSADDHIEPDNLTPQQRHEVTLREFQERLAGVGIQVSLGDLKIRSDADILAGTLWLNWYTSDGIDRPYLERPAFLPEPPNKAN